MMGAHGGDCMLASGHRHRVLRRAEYRVFDDSAVSVASLD